MTAAESTVAPLSLAEGHVPPFSIVTVVDPVLEVPVSVACIITVDVAEVEEVTASFAVNTPVTLLRANKVLAEAEMK